MSSMYLYFCLSVYCICIFILCIKYCVFYIYILHYMTVMWILYCILKRNLKRHQNWKLLLKKGVYVFIVQIQLNTQRPGVSFSQVLRLPASQIIFMCAAWMTFQRPQKKIKMPNNTKNSCSSSLHSHFLSNTFLGWSLGLLLDAFPLLSSPQDGWISQVQ